MENPMVNDRYWRIFEEDPKILGECLGCYEEIVEGDEVVDFNGDLIHAEHKCAYEYMTNRGILKVAGE